MLNLHDTIIDQLLNHELHFVVIIQPLEFIFRIKL
jgi:hypothetical protein